MQHIPPGRPQQRQVPILQRECVGCTSLICLNQSLSLTLVARMSSVVNLTLPDGSVRGGQVLEISGDKAIVQVRSY